MPSSEVTHTSAANPLWNPWCNDRGTFELYRRRCREEAEEMTCAGQAAEILAERVGPGETLLDAGCGGGYYLHALRRRGVPVEYHGLDFTPEMIALAREEMCPRAGLARERFTVGTIEGLDQDYDNILCFNVLTNCPHYGLALEAMLAHARRRVVLRESLGDDLVIRYTPDPYLDEGKRHIRVYHNIYPLAEIVSLMEERGFQVTQVPDRRSGDGVEMVVDLPHYWRILVAERSI
ncbi:MAG: class I SAM-dependent methyltransferase [Armatimonadetes bacterium]|nr:class I SAM-dependent methyltransferase [Armatimonadota bacterium]